MTLGLVLGAGGHVGAAFHRGVLRAMTDLGLDPASADVVVGTSAGSVVGASLRRSPVGGDVPERPAVPHRAGPRAAALRLWRRPRQVLGAALLRPGITAGGQPLQPLRAGQGASWPPAPLRVVAVRRRDGRRVVFGAPGEPRPDLAAAVAASCAVPGVYAPVTIDGVPYVDGGVHSPTNADVLAGDDLDLVVVSSPMSVQPRAVRGRLDLPLRLLFAGYLREEVWALRRRRTRVVLVEPDAAVLAVSGLNPLDGRSTAQVEARAYDLGLRQLRDVPLDLAGRRR